MKIIDFLQSIIKANLDNNCNLISNIYLSPKRDSDYPYCIISVKDVKNNSNIKETVFSCLVSIDVYDKNTDNINLISISEEIKNNLDSVLNNQNSNFVVKHITFERGDLKLFNELNLVWKITLEFKALVKMLD
ncbi:MAG: hypothetical protein LBG48_02550 [Rickettsiales bacterium]|jgi:hypothetical protein|nr:hypothetical protein [Rickettsiales bacterium]